jgi:hypothetical protein
VYQTVIEAAGGDNWVKANFLPTTLTGATISCLINLPEVSITSWDQLCTMFIRNFLGTYEHLSIAETLKTIRQKHDESLWDYVKYFYNARNTIPYIQDIEIINAFYDSVSNLMTVEEITMKKPKTVADLLASTDICIEASEARARLLKSQGKGTSRKKEDHEVNTANRGDADYLAWIASSKAPTPLDVIVERLSKRSVKPEESISKAEPELMIIDEPTQ